MVAVAVLVLVLKLVVLPQRGVVMERVEKIVVVLVAILEQTVKVY